jgi:bile acid:Na+ symporter, BASS family
MEGSVATQILLPCCLAAIMWVLGLSLTVADFRRVFVVPRGIAIGLANLLLVSPLLAFGSAELFGLAPAFAVGLVLLGASPGGTMANLLTHLARGEVALSVTMTAVSSVAALVTVPLYLSLAIDRFGASLDADVQMPAIVARVFLITVVPLALGMYVRRRRPEWVDRVYDRARKLSLLLFVLVVIAAVASEADEALDHVGEIAAAALALNVAAMGISFAVSQLAGLGDRQATAIAMELGVHNATLAITVASSIDSTIAIPAAVYSMFMFVTAGGLARIMARRNERAAGQAQRSESSVRASP